MRFIHIITALALALSAVACGDDEPEYLEPEQPVQPTPDPEDPEEPEKPDDPVTPPEPEPSRALSLDLPISTAFALDGKASVTISLKDLSGMEYVSKSDLTLSATVSTEANKDINAYNSANNSQYTLMPSSALQVASATIPTGNSEATMEITVDLDALDSSFSGMPFIMPLTVSASDETVTPVTLYVTAPVIRTLTDRIAIYLTGATPTAEIFNTNTSTNMKAVVDCPGGGFGNHDAGEIQMAHTVFSSYSGITLAITKYRLPRGNTVLPALDAYNIVRLMRIHASEWGGYSQVGIMGCSAGGHVAATVACYAPTEVDFQVLLYPVITMTAGQTHAGSRDALLGYNPSAEKVKAMSMEKQVTASTPPAYIGWSNDDPVVPPTYNAMAYYYAMLGARRPVTISEHATGGHSWATWTDFPTNMLSWVYSIR